MAKEICEDCGKVFDAGPRAFIRKDCHRKRLSNSAKRRNLSQIGRDSYLKQQSSLNARLKIKDE